MTAAAPHSRPDPPPGDVVLALDIGGTKLAAGVVDSRGALLSSAVCPTGVVEGVDAVLDRLLRLGDRVLADARARPQDLLGTGIGCGGPLDSEAGVLVSPPHLPGWRDVPVVAHVRERYGIPAVLDNDGTAGAAGEWFFGAGRGASHLLYLTVSTGIGGGAVLGGRVFRGAAGNGGEPGHVTVVSDGRPCRSCGRPGCLEAYASGSAIAERAAEAAAAAKAAGTPTALGRAGTVTAAEVAAAAEHGDPQAARVWGEAVAALGSGLTSLVNVYEPELVVLGGGVTRAGERLLGPVRAAVAEGAMGPAARAARIVPASAGDSAGVVGAAAVAFERIGGQVPG
ncbi:ROK family protein [Streptomyces sp. TR02-1]|uniref:ROK family protein n=1 Tax=Streptomyces sp. TR02-1 TaxID=3385977 RepID=UPI0039A0BEAC